MESTRGTIRTSRRETKHQRRWRFGFDRNPKGTE
jgi:hypothetical protein